VEFFGAFSKSTIEHLIVECGIFILWAFSKCPRLCLDLFLAPKASSLSIGKYSKKLKK